MSAGNYRRVDSTARRIERIETRRLPDDDPDLSYLEGREYDDVDDPAERERYIRQDRERLEAYGRTWATIGIDAQAIVYVDGVRQTIQSGGLWGIEDDSDESYLAEIEREELGALRSILRALGFSADAIDKATRSGTGGAMNRDAEFWQGVGDMADRARAAQAYIDAIRSKHKRAHAHAVDRALRNGLPMPKRSPNLSLMGAQAVELRLRAIYRGE